MSLVHCGFPLFLQEAGGYQRSQGYLFLFCKEKGQNIQPWFINPLLPLGLVWTSFLPGKITYLPAKFNQGNKYILLWIYGYVLLSDLYKTTNLFINKGFDYFAHQWWWEMSHHVTHYNLSLSPWLPLPSCNNYERDIMKFSIFAFLGDIFLVQLQ